MTTFDQIEYAAMTDVGVRRTHNQDNLAFQVQPSEDSWRQKGHIFLVADGMGGHAVGEKASEMASKDIPHTYFKYAQEGVPTALRKAFQEANATIHNYGERNAEFRGTGTTSTALVLRPDGAWIGHVGDSRCYRIRKGRVEQLTYDHSYVWEFARLKGMDPADVQDFPTNVIHRCLGPQPLVEVDIEGPHPVEPGDVYLLCSDGLSGQVNDSEIGAVASVLPAAEAVQFLVDLANLRGGPDNITVLIVRIADGASKGEVPNPPPVQRSGKDVVAALFDRVPWPYLALGAGVLALALAVAFKFASNDGLAIASFLAAAAGIAGGVAGLFTYRKPSRSRFLEDVSSELHVYRSTPYQLDKVLLEKIAGAARALKERAAEKQWNPDLEAYNHHSELAEQYLKAGDLAAAFREYCRAMRPLNEALQKHRNKEEVFQPLWDKSR